MKITLKRSFLIGLLLLLQIAFLFMAVYSLNSRAAYFYTTVQVLNIVVVVLLIYGRDNPTYKLAWVIIILMFPLFGIVIYFIAGTHHLSPKMKKRMQDSRNAIRKKSRQDPKILEKLIHYSELFARQARYILNADDKPVYQGTETKLLTPGNIMLEALLEELKKAERFIFMEYFIIEEGRMWDSILNILRQKAACGVEVRIIYDDMGSLDRISSEQKHILKAAGIRICAFNPIMPVLNKFMNYRDHRKITIVDGNVGMTGGINIGDEYINYKKPHGYWKDASILVKGDAVWSLTEIFLELWYIITGEKTDYELYRPEIHCEDDGFVLPFEDSPVDGINIAESVYMQIFNGAKRYVYITTPYLVPDNEMMNVLCLAAKSGVDVRIITPGIPDKWYVHIMTRANYRRLLESGVKIYEFMPGFIHGKTCVSDDKVGVVGSINMDYRSFYLQFECGVWLCGSSTLKDVKEDFLACMQVSKQIDLKDWVRHRRLMMVFEMIINLFSPLM